MRTAAYQNTSYKVQSTLSSEELFEVETGLMQLASRLSKLDWAKARAIDILQGRHLYKISVPAFRTWLAAQHKLIDNMFKPEVDVPLVEDDFKDIIAADVEEAISTGELSELDFEYIDD